jgi:tetratricopeptide (TPR) repeat protein
MLDRLLLLLILAVCTPIHILSEITSGRIKGDDEPRLVSWKVLEGITEPFGTSYESTIPIWKQMKISADQKAANMAMQQALHEYGQILRHPYVFGEMPSEERYDVFLSMAKLLKAMGFHQRAEMILHEAMTHTTNAYEANFQLGLLFLDKEDLETAKMYFKNCLFYQESDILILTYLTTILLTEGKIHEAAFFLSRIMSGLEERIRKLSFVMSESEIQSIVKAKIDYKILSNWIEKDLIVKVFYGEFHITPSSIIELSKYFINLYSWIQSGEMIGRFIFDLGQSLYEGGRSKIGLLMMKRGYETSSPQSEGIVSHEIVKLRLAIEYPVVPESILNILEYYLNITTFLSLTSKHYEKVDIENIMDMYWSIPLLGWSGLPIMPVMKELLWRFDHNLYRSDEWSINTWLDTTNHEYILESYHQWKTQQQKQEKEGKNNQNHKVGRLLLQDEVDLESVSEYEDLLDESKKTAVSKEGEKKKQHKSVIVPPSDVASSEPIVIEVGIFGGHMNNHPVGQTVLHNIINQIKDDVITGKSGLSPWKPFISITLISLPLFPDTVTKKIASKVDRIVNIPMDTKQAMKIIENLELDIVLFSDWSPFPDQQSLVFQSLRIAPIQICFYVRGTSCSSSVIDYYMIPKEIEDFYFHSVPAAGYNAIKTMNITTSSSPKGYKTFSKHLRPSWREAFVEQVLIVDGWPLLTASSIESFISLLHLDNSAANNRKSQSGTSTSSTAPHSPSAISSMSPDIAGSVTSLAIMEDYFSPNEYEGKIFFKDQPVAILPIYPTYVHPLMDDVLFQIMRAVPILQILIVVPDSFFTHLRDSRHKLSWARKLIRRLWERYTLYLLSFNPILSFRFFSF